MRARVCSYLVFAGDGDDDGDDGDADDNADDGSYDDDKVFISMSS